MASKKPVIHGRDHLPGGADPIPGMLTETYNQNFAEEHLIYPSTSLAAGGSVTLTWSSYDGTSITNLASATLVKPTDGGVYAAMVTVRIDPPSAEPAGDGIDLYLRAIQVSGPAWPPGYELPGLGSFVNPGNSSDVWYGTASVTAILGTSDYFTVDVTNRNTYAVDVQAALSVVRILKS